MSTAPDDPLRCWNEQAGPRWVALQDRIDAQLAPLGTAILEALAVQPGERILDVGCGCGHTLRELARRVGETGSVTGIDISEPMLAFARDTAPPEAAARVELVCADAELHAFERASYDVVFSRFGVMFFNNPDAAFKNLRRALKPGGRIGFACWQSLGDNPWAQVPFSAVLELSARLSPERPPELPPMLRPGAPGPFSLADAEQVSALLERSGFSQVEIQGRRGPIALGGARTLDEAVAFTMEIGPASHVVRDTDPALRPQATEALRQALAPYATADGVWMQSAIHVVTAIA